MMLAPFVKIVARGQGRARPMTQGEAYDAMHIMLSGNADPEAVGALLMILRYRGETADEIAGFTAALRAFCPVQQQADLDWPCYAAGRTRGAPLFLLAAKLVTQAGYTVALHGWNSHQTSGASVGAALTALDIPYAAHDAPLTYYPLKALSPAAFGLLTLRDKLGLRSCINTVLRMWNPTEARCTVQGVFHPSYRGLQAQAAKKLGQTSMTVIKGGGGEFERNPSKVIQVFGLQGGEHFKAEARALLLEPRRLHEADKQVDPTALWWGQTKDAFAASTVVATAGLALFTLGAAPTVPEADVMAANLWMRRHDPERRSA